MNVNDDSILIKYKQAGMPVDRIAKKLGISTEEVETRWKNVVECAQHILSGYSDLTTQYHIMCQQYQLLGQSMKIVASALGNPMSPVEVKALITTDPDKTVENLFKSCILLRPFTGVNPMEALEQEIKGN